jgi:hypothetical protein
MKKVGRCLDQKILREAEQVYAKVSKKNTVLYKVVHSRHTNKSKQYSGRKILEAYEINVPEYHQSVKGN